LRKEHAFIVECYDNKIFVGRCKYKTFFSALRDYRKMLCSHKDEPEFQVTLSNYISPYMVSQKKHGI
jgi:hypothetical protein